MEDETLDEKLLASAIDTRDRSYKLLLWINDAIANGQILASRAARHSNGPEAVTEWLRANRQFIPEELRPGKRALGRFAAFFSTYLTSSFDVVESPGTKGEGPVPSCGCTCELCVRIINAPHLRAKKLYARDKRRANALMAECLLRLAREHGLQIDEALAERIVVDTKTRREAAYLAYGHWLIKRLSGESDGPSILALWRLIAWDSRGGVIRGFELRLEDFEKAEQALLESIRKARQ